jgi:nucleoid-associated protein YgaU
VKAQPSVAEAAPSQPPAPVVVARTDAAAPAAVSATPRIAISGVAADEAGRLVATGAAPPGAFLRLYLNGSLLASVTAGVDGLWSLTVEHGMKGGSYAIRADEVDRRNDSVIARAEVPFNYPAHIAELVAPIKPPAGGSAPATADEPGAPVALSEPQKPAPQASPTVASTDAAVAPAPAAASQAQTPAAPPQPANPAVASPQAAVAPAPVAPSAPVPPAHPTAQANAAPAGAAHAVVRLVSTTRVVPGDSLWAISAHLYGDGLRYTQIYAANAGQIRNPRLIYPGQIFVVPQTTPN